MSDVAVNGFVSDSDSRVDIFAYVEDLTHSVEELKAIVGSLKEMVDRVEFSTKLLYTNSEVQKMLGVCPNTLKSYRDNGLIGYSHIGDKFFYSTTDIMEFMDKNHHVAFRYERVSV